MIVGPNYEALCANVVKMSEEKKDIFTYIDFLA